MKFFVVVALVVCAGSLVAGQSIDDCLKQDSIACVQKSLYRKAKSFFGQESFELITGVSLVKSKNDRSARTNNEVVFDQEIEGASGVSERQQALESFVGDEASNFLSGRSLKVNFAPALEKIGATARAIQAGIPEEITQAVDEVAEGRGKKKLSKILPLLLMAKAKIGIIATVSYFFLALIAKKAIVVSLISLAFSAFVGLRQLWNGKGSSVLSGAALGTGYNSAWNGASAGSYPASASANSWSAGAGQYEEPHPTYQAAGSGSFNGYH